MNKLRNYCVILLSGSFVFGLLGCAAIKESAKGFAGLSTRALEEGRKDAIARTFNQDYPALRAKVKEILQRTGSYIYAQDDKKKMIAIYLSESDTTPVGIFFKEIDAKNTEIAVSSRSTHAKELVSGRIFSVLDGKITLKELEGKINGKEEKEETATDQQTY